MVGEYGKKPLAWLQRQFGNAAYNYRRPANRLANRHYYPCVLPAKSLLHMMYSHHPPSLNSYQKQHGIQAEQRKNQPTPSTPSTRAARLLLTAEGCA
jgi:hypothetical protein